MIEQLYLSHSSALPDSDPQPAVYMTGDTHFAFEEATPNFAKAFAPQNNNLSDLFSGD